MSDAHLGDLGASFRLAMQLDTEAQAIAGQAGSELADAITAATAQRGKVEQTLSVLAHAGDGSSSQALSDALGMLSFAKGYTEEAVQLIAAAAGKTESALESLVLVNEKIAEHIAERQL